jgi:hypothetical protein
MLKMTREQPIKIANTNCLRNALISPGYSRGPKGSHILAAGYLLNGASQAISERKDETKKEDGK